MKGKGLLCLFFVCLISTHIRAQSKIGLVVFPQISSLTNKEIRKDPVNSNMLTFSGGLGLTYTYYLSEKISLQAGLIYSSQNQKIKSNYQSQAGWSIEHVGKKRFDYLKVPVLFRYTIPVKEKLNVVPFAGLQLSYLLKYDGGMVVYGDNYFDLPATPAGNNYYKKAGLDLPLGVNLEYALTPQLELVGGLKMDYGLTGASNKNPQVDELDLSALKGFSASGQRHITYALNLGLMYTLGKADKTAKEPKPAKVKTPKEPKPVATKPAPEKKPVPAAPVQKPEPEVVPPPVLPQKDTIELQGQEDFLLEDFGAGSKTNNSKDEVQDVLNQSYSSVVKGIVYKKGTSEILNNTKIVLHSELGKVDSSVTFIEGSYTLRVQDPSSKHRIVVSRKGYKPQVIELPDSLLQAKDPNANILKIQLEQDGSGNEKEEEVTIVLKGKVVNSATGATVSGATITITNNMDKSVRTISVGADGKYSIQLKKYSHYSISAEKSGCTAVTKNQSTISIRESVVLEEDLMIYCQ
jgi:predicted  nucleic acid-binding Zn-ribbon protein